MKPTIVCILPYYFKVKDYRCIVLDFLCKLFLEDKFISICRPEMEWLISKQPKAVRNYLEIVKVLCTYYKIDIKVNNIVYV